MESVDDLPFGTDDAVVTTSVDGSAYMENKREGMRAYPTQISMEQGFFALSNSIGMEFMAHEYYQLVKGAAERSDTELEKDLFAGLGIALALAIGALMPAAVTPLLAGVLPVQARLGPDLCLAGLGTKRIGSV